MTGAPGQGAEVEAAKIVRRAERRLGEMLAGMEKAKGTRLGGNKVLPPGPEPTLSDLGITKMDSHRWQREATVLITTTTITTTTVTADCRAGLFCFLGGGDHRPDHHDRQLHPSTPL